MVVGGKGGEASDLEHPTVTTFNCFFVPPYDTCISFLLLRGFSSSFFGELSDLEHPAVTTFIFLLFQTTDLEHFVKEEEEEEFGHNVLNLLTRRPRGTG